jgi:hypothetical protein
LLFVPASATVRSVGFNMALDSSKRIKSMTPTASGKNIGINATEEQPLFPREPK